jgi:very-short-patch-repair endonuclease
LQATRGRFELNVQENGYRILRFLAEDVGKELDAVLDTILRSLAHSQRHACRDR